jgi:hypothetical protein
MHPDLISARSYASAGRSFFAISTSKKPGEADHGPSGSNDRDRSSVCAARWASPSCTRGRAL